TGIQTCALSIYYCDWYIEMAKIPLNADDEVAKQTTRSVLAHVLDEIMRMLHPYMPFITEEIWQQIPHEGESITVAAWPTYNESYHDEVASKEMKQLVDIIKSIRNIRAEVDTPMSREIPILIKAQNKEIQASLDRNRTYLTRFSNPRELTIATELVTPEDAMTAIVTGAEIFLHLEGLIDYEKEIARLEKELKKWESDVELVSKKLSNESFVNKASEKFVEGEKQKQTYYINKREKIKLRLAEIKK